VKNVLPLYETPIAGYLHHAFPLSIMPGHPDFQPWFYSNYIQLYCSKDFTQLDCPLNFYFYQDYNHYPLLECNRFNRELLGEKWNFYQAIQHAIDKGYYIVCFVDEFYIPGSRFFSKAHVSHDLMIYGYDTEHHTLHIAGFLDHKYSTSTIAFEDFHEAFLHADWNDLEYVKYFYLIKRNEDVSYAFNIELTIHSLEDYLSADTRSHTTFFYSYKPIAFGVDVYTYLVKSVKDATERQGTADIRPIHILWEHKKIMADRLSYLVRQHYISQKDLYAGFKNVVDAVNNLRVALLKSRATMKPVNAGFFEEKLLHAAQTEISILRSVTDELKSIRNSNHQQIIIHY
jgi:hypothetical protein